MPKKIVISESMLRGLVRTILNEISSNDAYSRFYKDFCTPEQWSVFMSGSPTMTPFHKLALDIMRGDAWNWDSAVAELVSKVWNTLPPEGRQYAVSYMADMAKSGKMMSTAWLKRTLTRMLQKKRFTEEAYSSNGLVVLYETDSAMVTCTTSYASSKRNFGDSHWCTASDIGGRFNGFRMFERYTIEDMGILLQFVDKKDRANSIQAQYFTKSQIDTACDFMDHEISELDIRQHLEKMGLDRNFYLNVIDDEMFRKLQRMTIDNVNEEQEYWSVRIMKYDAKMKKSFTESANSGKYDAALLDTMEKTGGMQIGMRHTTIERFDTPPDDESMRYPHAAFWPFKISDDRSLVLMNVTLYGTNEAENSWIMRDLEDAGDDYAAQFNSMALLIRTSGGKIDRNSEIVGRYPGYWDDSRGCLGILGKYIYDDDATYYTVVNIKTGAVIVSDAYGAERHGNKVIYYKGHEDYLDGYYYVLDCTTGEFEGKRVGEFPK